MLFAGLFLGHVVFKAEEVDTSLEHFHDSIHFLPATLLIELLSVGLLE